MTLHALDDVDMPFENRLHLHGSVQTSVWSMMVHLALLIYHLSLCLHTKFSVKAFIVEFVHLPDNLKGEADAEATSFINA